MSSAASHPDSTATAQTTKRPNRTRASAIAASFLLTSALLGFAAFRDQIPPTVRFWRAPEAQHLQQNAAEFVIARIEYSARNQHPDFKTTIVEENFSQNHHAAHDPRHTEDAHGMPSWAHTYPQAEEHILQLASEATGIQLSGAAHVVVPLDSKELFQYPFSYLTEPGEMDLSGSEIANFREYLLRGGFTMVDDFNTAEALDRFTTQMNKVFPNRRLVELRSDNPIFHAFNDTPPAAARPPYTHAGGGAPKFYGYYDDHGRLCMIVNHDNNLGAFWVWLDQPAHPLRASVNGARFGLNYFIYSLTH